VIEKRREELEIVIVEDIAIEVKDCYGIGCVGEEGNDLGKMTGMRGEF